LAQSQQPPPESQFAPSPEISNDDETQTAAALHTILVDDGIRIAEDVAANHAAAYPGQPPDPRTLNEAKRSKVDDGDHDVLQPNVKFASLNEQPLFYGNVPDDGPKITMMLM
jgi:hypothetical protein